jgi:geranylgeranyl pyrophosphate synthase
VEPALAWESADLGSILERERGAVEAALGRATELCWPDPASPVARAIRYALEGGGKRLRPILFVRAFRALRGAAPDAVYDAACSIELIHTYSLVHDDLPCMDDDGLRRGRATTHRVFGTRVATVAGAAMIPAAFRVLAEGLARLGGGAVVGPMAQELGLGAGAAGMVGGQVLDLEAEGRALDVAALDGIHRRKTGALFVSACRMGGLAAGGRTETVAALGSYGAALGLAFQVTDDILDETGETDILGKDAGRDRARGKATVPALLGLDGARQRAQRAADEAVAALARVGLRDASLEALARFAVERDR